MIALFTDFGMTGPYIGQMRAKLISMLESYHPVVDLMLDAPSCNPKAASYLLAAITKDLPLGSIVIAVVDPGVGSEDREPILLEADGRHFIGPGNGLFGPLMQHSTKAKLHKIIWRPESLSSTFHGRDLFAPFAAKLLNDDLRNGDDLQEMKLDSMPSLGPTDLAEVVYVDHFGNAMTGLRASAVSISDRVWINGHELGYASTFSDVPQGDVFWCINSSGLVEIAVNCGRAADALNVSVGCELQVLS